MGLTDSWGKWRAKSRQRLRIDCRSAILDGNSNDSSYKSAPSQIVHCVRSISYVCVCVCVCVCE
jgi:hypothetical protein